MGKVMSYLSLIILRAAFFPLIGASLLCEFFDPDILWST